MFMFVGITFRYTPTLILKKKFIRQNERSSHFILGLLLRMESYKTQLNFIEFNDMSL